ncbi:c-type heme family protein [Myroides odoratimimus]|uniref:c-type heme family protein n=1 Tax=Myroides odoratimimus TaxID=76832 RepID=UPI0031015470
MKKIVMILVMVSTLFSCQNKNPKTQQVNEVVLKQQSDSLTQLAQLAIMKNLKEAMIKGGDPYAIEFCNLEAINLTNSVIKEQHLSIQRLSDKNRNPENNLKTAMDKDLFELFKDDKALQDTLLYDNHNYIYYKRINLAMGTCLKCHASSKSIAPNVLTKLDELYPNDLAKNYSLNDFRGLWKITYENN